ncbi:hypothetical protein J6590_014752 [Homalodisca vitripennis]|nr:hypothetical protein J6590_014752 [Homalodisca vitripennis]
MFALRPHIQVQERMVPAPEVRVRQAAELPVSYLSLPEQAEEFTQDTHNGKARCLQHGYAQSDWS